MHQQKQAPAADGSPRPMGVWLDRYTDVHGKRRRLSLGTKVRSEAKARSALVRVLESRGDHGVLKALHEGGLPWGVAMAEHRGGRLGDLDRLTRATDLTPLLEAWGETLRRTGRADDTVRHYLHAIRSLIPGDRVFPSGDLTVAVLQKWLDQYPGSDGTRLKAAAAMSGFCSHLTRLGVLAQSPMAYVQKPSVPAGRDQYLTTEQAQELVDAAPLGYKAVFALAYGAGMEIGAILGVRAESFGDAGTRSLRAPGTKTWSRDRVVTVAEWAWPYVAFARFAYATGPLFPTLDRWKVTKEHKRLVKLLGFPEGLRLHDARHHWAVRNIKAGAPMMVVAKQLGHKDTTMVSRVYGVYVPTTDEVAHWDRVATEREKGGAMWGGR